MKVVLTGAEGFLGWHLRCRAPRDHRPRGGAGRPGRAGRRLPELVADADAVIHVAGVNRADDDELVDGNVGLARDVAAALARPCRRRRRLRQLHPGRQRHRRTPRARRGAADVLRDAAERVRRSLHRRAPAQPLRRARSPGLQLVRRDVRRRVVSGDDDPRSPTDRSSCCTPRARPRRCSTRSTRRLAGPSVPPAAHRTSVQQVWETLERFHATYVAERRRARLGRRLRARPLQHLPRRALPGQLPDRAHPPQRPARPARRDGAHATATAARRSSRRPCPA